MRYRRWTRFARHRPPPGVLSLRYFAPGLSPALRRHRQLLRWSLPTRPRVVAWTAVLGMRLRWTVLDVRKVSAKALAAHGNQVLDSHGIDLQQQRREIRRLAYVHGIHPQTYYLLRLYLPGPRQDMWLYVYDAEVAAFHHLRTATLGDPESARAATALLSDKAASAVHLAEHGVTTTPTIALLPAGSSVDSLPPTDGATYLCKPQSGSGARGIFRYSTTDGSLVVAQLSGRAVPEDRVSDLVNQRLAQRDYLVQPLLRTHPALEHLGAGHDEAITVRLITEVGGPYCAFIEIPTQSEDKSGYCSLAIDLESGRIEATAGPSLFVSDHALDAVIEQARGLEIPHWKELRDMASRAHASLDSIYGIAWDFVVTNGGPVLLEGNTGWGTLVPQYIYGPLLQEG